MRFFLLLFFLTGFLLSSIFLILLLFKKRNCDLINPKNKIMELNKKLANVCYVTEVIGKINTAWSLAKLIY